MNPERSRRWHHPVDISLRTTKKSGSLQNRRVCDLYVRKYDQPVLRSLLERDQRVDFGGRRLVAAGARGAVEGNALLPRLGGRGEWNLPNTMARRLLGPISPWWHRNLMPPTRFAKSHIRNPEFLRELVDGLRPDTV